MDLPFQLSEYQQKSVYELDLLFSEAYAWIKNLDETTTDAMERFAKISAVGASTRIENALLTDPEVLWIDTLLSKKGYPSDFKKYESLIKNKLSKDRERSIEEVAGCRKVIDIVYQDAARMSPLREVEIRSLHYELLRYYPKSSHYRGTYKVSPNSVVEYNKYTKERRVVFQTADPGPITQVAMSDLIDWYNTMHQNYTPTFSLATAFVYRFLAIHPFQDGNGRIGRALLTLCLLQSQSEVIRTVSRYLSIDRQIERYKEAYYLSLNRTSESFSENPKDYRISYFFDFLMKSIKRSFDDLKIYHQKWEKERQLSTSAKKVLECFRNYPEIRLTTKYLIEKTEMPRRTITKTLLQLTQLGFIQKLGIGAGTRYQITF